MLMDPKALTKDSIDWKAGADDSSASCTKLRDSPPGGGPYILFPYIPEE
jgi:hypothetical protein